MSDVNKRLDELYEQYGIKPPEPVPVAQPPPAPEPPKTTSPALSPPIAPKVDDKWDKSIDFVLRWEGGYVNHPNDPGGETNRGITAAALKKAYAQGIVKHNIVKNITKDEAKAIYRANYWLPYGWGELAWPVCLIMLDLTVNHGGGGMAKIAQRALVVRGHAVTVDGAYGPKTKVALWKAAEAPLPLAQALCDMRKDFYERIIKAKPSQAAFKKGWFNRLRELARVAGVKSPV